jgi:hypothetical protein
MNRIVPPVMSVGLKGFMRLQTINEDSGKVTSDTGFFENTILTEGRNIMADGSTWMNFCQVGTDATPPSKIQTGLLGFTAGTSTIISTLTGASSEEPYYGWKRKVFRFPVGSVAANLNEVGVGWTATEGAFLISRALIINTQTGLPGTVTPKIDEMLDVTYELRYYSPTEDVIGPQVTLNGIVYNTKTRAANATSATAWAFNIGSAMGRIASYGWNAYDDILGTVLQSPSGVSSGCDTNNQYNSEYASNSYEIEVNCPCGSTGWNLGSGLGIRSLLVLTTAGYYQTEFAAVGTGDSIPKTVEFRMLMNWTLGWTERI